MQANEQIIDVLEYLCKKIGVTIDFTNKNILPYVNQLCEKYINWEIASSVTLIVIGIIAGIGVYFLCKWLYKKGKEENEEAYHEFMAIIIAIFLGFAILVIFPAIFNIIECVTFPEKAIYDYVTTLMEAK